MRRLIALLLSTLLVGFLPAAQSAVADGSDSGDPTVRQSGPGIWEGRVRKAVDRRHRARTKTTEKGPNDSDTNRKVAEKPHLTKAQWAAFLAMCSQTYDDAGCRESAAAPKSQIGTAKLVRSLSSVARTLIVQLQLPDPTPRFGPDPSVNEWKMAAVGFPLWLWTDGPTTVSNRATAYGITFTLRATWQSTTFDMGDGHQVTCTRTPKYPTNSKPARKSPDCGYTYRTASLPKGSYDVTATTNWLIDWSALGQSGSLPGTHTGNWSLPVGELNALVVK